MTRRTAACRPTSSSVGSNRCPDRVWPEQTCSFQAAQLWIPSSTGRRTTTILVTTGVFRLQRGPRSPGWQSMSITKTASSWRVRTRRSTRKRARYELARPPSQHIQQRNGSVLVKYGAADPFSPGGEGLAMRTPLNVNGTNAIKPTMDGPRVGGSVSNFPAIEVYSHRPGANTTTLTQAWPLFVDGPLGPAAGLWWHKPIGDAALELRFDDLTPNLGPSPLLPHLGPVPSTAPIGPLPVAAPPATYPLGPVDHPPHIGVHDPAIVLPPLLGR